MELGLNGSPIMDGGEKAASTSASKRTLGKAGYKNWKSGLDNRPAQPPTRCPECGSERLWRDGVRYTRLGDVQRWLCRDCGFRFSKSTTQLQVEIDIPGKISKGSDPQADHTDRLTRRGNLPPEKGLDHLSLASREDVASHNPSTPTIVEKQLNKPFHYTSGRRVCVSEAEMKNLAEVESRTEKRAAGATKQTTDVKGKIIEYLWHLKKEGYSESTIKQKSDLLHRLLSLGADLNVPDTVKAVIARLNRSESYKLLLCIAYEGFAKYIGLTWTRPSYKQAVKLPFIPHEAEIDALIAGVNRKTATLLKLIKETAMRLGEAWMLTWSDFDEENRIITCNNPEKSSKPRIFKISPELTQMIKQLPKINQFIFACGRDCQGKIDPAKHKKLLERQKGCLTHQRRRVAFKLQNPRIEKISYHTLRHWKATKLYHETKDILYVMKFLGHRSIKNTLIYIDLEKACYPNGGDVYITKVAKTEAEICSLIEAGFDYVLQKDGLAYFRKRK